MDSLFISKQPIIGHLESEPRAVPSRNGVVVFITAQLFFLQSVNSVSPQVPIVLAACRRFEMVRASSNHCKKYCNFTLFPSVEIFWQSTVSNWFPAIWLYLSTVFPHQKIRWNYGIFCSERLVMMRIRLSEIR